MILILVPILLHVFTSRFLPHLGMKRKIDKTAFEVKEARFAGPALFPTIIRFRRERVNLGGAYDFQTGIFTAPADGLYSFYFYALAGVDLMPAYSNRYFGAQSTTQINPHVFLAKNRGRVLDIVCSSESRVCSGHSVLEMNDGDQVRPVLVDNKVIDPLSARFSGYLVYEEE